MPIIYLHAQPRTSAPAILSDVSASVRFVSPEPPTPPSSAQVGPSPVPSVLPAQATSSEPSASAAPNTPLVTSIVPASPSSLAASKTQAVRLATSFALDTAPEFTAATAPTGSISPAPSMTDAAPASSVQKASFRSSDAPATSARAAVPAPPSAEEATSVPIFYLHALEFGAPVWAKFTSSSRDEAARISCLRRSI